MRRDPGFKLRDYSTYDLDFTGEGRRRVHLFSYVLGYSRRQYLRFVEAQDFATTLREHVRAFEHLGGVAATCLYDNMKVVVTRLRGRRADLQPAVPGLRHPLRLPAGPAAPGGRKPRGRWNGRSDYVETSLFNGRTFTRWIISTRSPPGGWPRSPTSASTARRRQTPLAVARTRNGRI